MDIIKEFLEKYGFFIIGGAIGAMVHRMRKRMTNLQFIKFFVTAIIVALATGIISREIFNIPETVTYVICGIFGAFSEDILNELEDFIKSLSDIAKKKIGGSDFEIKKQKDYEDTETGN